MKMQMNIFVVLILVALMQYADCKKFGRLHSQSLTKSRCELVCHDASPEDKGPCRSDCKSSEIRPGTCPATVNFKWVTACIEACLHDLHCDDTQKCCRYGCSTTCSEPIDLHTVPGLPAVPVVEEIKERRKAVTVRWSDGVGDKARAVPGRVIYLLEGQNHVGPKFDESRLGDWFHIVRTNKTKVALKNVLRPGRWYRFRVASVSADGTRGFSAPSSPFTPRKGPKAPSPPKRLKVRPVRSTNGTITVRLEWKEPHSELPVNKYKVYWSRRVRGLAKELDSVLVNHQTVPHEKTSVEIKGLQPNSMYFLQVQTIAQFGDEKLRSDKASIFYNTTNATIDRPPAALRGKKDNKIVKDLKLHNIVWFNHTIKAKISWKSAPTSDEHPRRYFVFWTTAKCDKPQKQVIELSAITQQNTFEIYELDYNCSYKVNVNKSEKPRRPESELVLTVPDCDYFQKRVNGTNINCKS